MTENSSGFVSAVPNYEQTRATGWSVLWEEESGISEEIQVDKGWLEEGQGRRCWS